ncbi:CLUMA_CG012394, isoform A [Clunio marinus]|uniref:CLUMA_CG012394, isoform A n=1 Tax=Clunio marinus TaxID=568069 RepID=A0A1J1II18_9DIPT|nr:CLUMA_CG012394, isoform A [Clunio marinus]
MTTLSQHASRYALHTGILLQFASASAVLCWEQAKGSHTASLDVERSSCERAMNDGNACDLSFLHHLSFTTKPLCGGNFYYYLKDKIEIPTRPVSNDDLKVFGKMKER